MLGERRSFSGCPILCLCVRGGDLAENILARVVWTSVSDVVALLVGRVRRRVFVSLFSRRETVCQEHLRFPPEAQAN